MRAARWLHFRHGLGAIAAALIAVSISLTAISDSRAQNPPPDKRAQKKPPPKPVVRAPVVRAPIRGAIKGPVVPNRTVVAPTGRPPIGRAPMLGPNAPINARTVPNGINPNARTFPNGINPGAVSPNFRGPGGFAARDPRALGNRFNTAPGLPKGPGPAGLNTRSANVGPLNRSFGSRPVGRPSIQATRGLGLPGSRGFVNRDPRMRAVNAATPQARQLQRVTHRTEMLAVRTRLPTYPLPGERNFTGVPPVAETRFIQTEMVCQWGPNMTQAGIEEIARRHNLEIAGIQRSALTGGTLVHFRIAGARPARDVVRAMEAEQIISQPNYVYDAAQAPAAPQHQEQSQQEGQEPASAASSAANGEQYAANMLKLAEAHKIATGKGVTVAVIDSQIDSAHPELAKGIAETFDAVGRPDQPHTHGTGMAGAIVSQDRLMGVAPGARTLAIHAFATGTQQSPQATTQSIISGMEWALNKGARIINMSFAGPYDPILALAIKKASERGAILIAAVGNAGPKSPPLYPGADPHVIGVTAVDESDRLYGGANIGAQVAIAAPGVDVMVPAPAGAYQLTTGTSVAAAHVSGVAALLLEKHPEADARLVLEVLTASATRQGANKRDDKLGWGLIDPIAALAELDARLADAKVAGTTPAAPATAPQRAATNAPSAPPAPAAAATRALPRPGVFPPKQ
ncbi:MAG: S8 family serine peptidase [Alphaproteobacteria bacterium]|nr:S8 family serine peptidase [Alphaproteobacteria bacterium]